MPAKSTLTNLKNTTAVVNAGIIDATPVTATPVTAAPVVVAPVIAEDDKIEDIMSEGNKGTMRLYDVETGKLMKTYPPMAEGEQKVAGIIVVGAEGGVFQRE